jgi:hydroxymethylglutaryl-CoA lyase
MKSLHDKIQLVECPRDAMQGWPEFIPTEKKAAYLNTLLRVGFHTLDFGSFVSPKAIPQLKDTREVLEMLDLSHTQTRLLAIIANVRGAREALASEQIYYLGFPFSVSEEFQKRNTNSGIAESLERVREIQALCLAKNKELVVYLSMGFGNPYGEPWNADIVIRWADNLIREGIKTIAVSDTIGVSNAEKITHLFSNLIPSFPGIEFGAHLHSTPATWFEKVDSAVKSGCHRFDSAFKGIGGCPMADDVLTGNLATENVVSYFGGPEANGLNREFYDLSVSMANEIFHS